MKDINALVSWIEENAMTEDNFENGEPNFNFIEADICMTAADCDVADPLPPLPFKPSFADIDAAFDIICAA